MDVPNHPYGAGGAHLAYVSSTPVTLIVAVGMLRTLHELELAIERLLSWHTSEVLAFFELPVAGGGHAAASPQDRQAF